MSKTLETLIVELDGRSDRLLQELRRGDAGVKTFVDKTEQNFNRMDSRFASIGSKLKSTFAFFGVTLGARAFANWIDGAVSAGDQTTRAARALADFKETSDRVALSVADRLTPAIEALAGAMKHLAPTAIEEARAAVERLRAEVKNPETAQRESGTAATVERLARVAPDYAARRAARASSTSASQQLLEAEARLNELEFAAALKGGPDSLAGLGVLVPGRRTSVAELDARMRLPADWQPMPRFVDPRLTGVETGAQRADSFSDLHALFPDMARMEPINEAFAKSNEQIDKFTKKMAEADRNSKAFADSFASAFESRGIEALLDGDVSGAVRGLTRDFAEMIIRLTVLKPLAEGVSAALLGAGGGGGFSFASLFGFAGGGRPPMGRASIVGEHGPELFVPDVGGRILSNAQSRAALSGGGPTVQITQHNQYGSGPQYDADLMTTARVAAQTAFDAVMKHLSGRR